MTRLISALTLILGLCLTAEAQTGGQQVQISPSGTYGETVPYRSLRGTTPDACAANCEADNLCRAWTLTPPTFRKGPRCELRTTPDNTGEHPAAISGVDRTDPASRSTPGQPMATPSAQAPVETLAGSPTRTPSKPSARTTVEPTQAAPPQREERAAEQTPAEPVPDFSEMRITVESYPPGYGPDTTEPTSAPAPTPVPDQPEPATPQTAPSLKQASPRLETQSDTETPPAAEAGNPTQPETTQRIISTRRYSRTLPREMVTTREDLARQSDKTTSPSSAESITEDQTAGSAPAQTATPSPVTSQQQETGSRARTAPTNEPTGPWPGLKRTPRNAEQPSPPRDRPLPGLRKDGAYSIQDMNVLPGDFKDNAGLQGRLPSGHNEAFDEEDDDDKGEPSEK